ncbi:lysophospholipid acyltransferase family protein [Clostridium sp. BJN0001]|uniref:lysophospholipid acyltransferase family protein n=1 Tax=Clostridium sp. BJN0001 TaxID=2930219 RepID=UPI001FD5B4E6|nr:lysophospholipid acyltransferase family protein [Clostridium sp. BJN0001]
MLSPVAVKLFRILPKGILLKLVKTIVNYYIGKYADIKISGMENIDDVKKSRIFICNHLSNSDGLLLSKILKEKSDPYFIAGIKLSNDPLTSLGADIVKHINIKPNSADKDAITKIVKTLKAGEDILIFPEGTRSRTGQMIKGKKGILLFTKMTKATVIPIGMTGSEKLLPIAEDGDMASEKWHNAQINIKIGKKVEFPKKSKEEDKHEYEDKCMDILMKGIANLLPEDYRGVYK